MPDVPDRTYSSPDIESDPRTKASLHIWKDEEGHRRIEFDGQPLPCWTYGDIVVEHRHIGAHERGGFWADGEDDPYNPIGGTNIVTDVHLTFRLIDGSVTVGGQAAEVLHTPLSERATMEE